MSNTVEEFIQVRNESAEMEKVLEGEQFIVYAEEEGDLYRIGIGHGQDPIDALNSLLKMKEIDLEANLFVVKGENLEGPFIIKLNPSAVRPEQMVGV